MTDGTGGDGLEGSAAPVTLQSGVVDDGYRFPVRTDALNGADARGAGADLVPRAYSKTLHSLTVVVAGIAAVTAGIATGHTLVGSVVSAVVFLLVAIPLEFVGLVVGVQLTRSGVIGGGHHD